MKYNIGDRVRIKNFDWFRNEGSNMVVVYMTKYYGEVVTIKSIHNGFYRIKEDGGQYCWIDEMFECKMEEETKSHNNMCKQLIDEMKPNVEVNVKTKPELNFKVGDKVLIKSLDWYNENKDADSCVHCGDRVFDNYMSVFCGSVVTIGEVGLYGYGIREDMHCRTWTDEMIKGLVEEETKPKFKVGDKITSGKATLTILKLLSEKYVVEDNFGKCGILYFNSQDEWKIVEEESIIDLTVKGEEIKERIEIAIPEGYEYVIESGKIIFTKKKKEYPKTYEECCEVLVGRKPKPNEISFDKMELCLVDLDNTQSIYFQNPYLPQFNSLFRLRMCRDAYWKIAGEEKGLEKPWEPDWTNYNEYKFVIGVNENKIIKCYNTIAQFVLAFPTEEMRDAFYENFKELIEQCKELL